MVTPVAGFVIVTVTFGRTLPEGSVTVPSKVAVSWPNAQFENIPSSSVPSSKFFTFRTLKILPRSVEASRTPLAHFETKFIASLRNEFSNV